MRRNFVYGGGVRHLFNKEVKGMASDGRLVSAAEVVRALLSSVSLDSVRVAARSSHLLASASARVEKYIFPAFPVGLR